LEGVEGGFMEIEISGYKVLIDDEDWERVKQYSWYVDKDALRKKGIYYFRADIRVSGKKTHIFLHRTIMCCTKGDGKIVDHINRNTLDCRRCNLRIATPSQNGCNKPMMHYNKAGYKGVGWARRENKWRARITINKKETHIGYFTDVIEAAKAYDKMAIKLHGEFAYTNFPKNNYIKGATN